jgi:DNA-binding transcriptional MerR regulator
MILSRTKITEANMDLMDIPDKLTFKRQEVIRLTKLDGKVIDYWQREFGGFAPTINKMGDQFYTRNDVQLILKIKQWMIVEKIEKSKIKNLLITELGFSGTYSEGNSNNANFEAKAQNIPKDKLKIIKRHLQEILTILDKNDKR